MALNQTFRINGQFNAVQVMFNGHLAAILWKLRLETYQESSIFEPDFYLLQGTSKEADFTKADSGSDAFAKDLALAYPCRSGFVMQTGKERICENWTKLPSK